MLMSSIVRAGCVSRSTFARALVALLIALLAPRPALAQCGPDDRGWFGGGITRVYGNSSAFAIVAIGTRLARVNTTNPAALSMTWRTPPLEAVYGDQGISGRLTDLAVASNRVYATIADDLYIFDANTGTQLAVHPNLGSAIHASGTTLYIADFYNLRILDMTDVNLPLNIGQVSLASVFSATPTSIAVSGNRAYVAIGDFLNESGVVAFDISTPSAPVRLGQHSVTNSLGVMPTVNVALNFVLFTPGNNELQVVDFATPASPVVRSTITSTSRVAHSRVSGSLFWIAAGAEGVKTYGLNNSGATSFRGSYNTDGWAERLAGSQPFFVADREGGLRLLDITSGGSPTFISAFGAVPGMVRDVVGGASATYILDNNALRIYSRLIDPVLPPITRGVVPLTNPHRFFVSGRTNFFAYIADGTGGLKIVEVTNPDAPLLRGSLAVAGTATHVASSNGQILLTSQNEGVRVIDISNLAAPVLRSTITVTGVTRYYAAVGNGVRAYLCTSAGMSVVNLTNPAAPIVERSYADPDGFSEGVISGNYLYCGKRNYPGGFTVYDISNPAIPTVARVFDYAINGCVDLQISGNLLYLSAYSGVYIFDVSDPLNPAHVTGIDSPWPEQYDDERNALMLGFAEGGIAFAQAQRGVQIASIPTGWAPTSRDPFVTAQRCLGENYVFSTNLSANPATGITYQWTKNSQPIPGANAPTLVLTNLRGVDAGLYSCFATNACGTREGSYTRLRLCPADFDDGSGTGQCDGGVTVDDLLFFLILFEQGSILADLDDGSFTGTPDGGVTIDDLLFFLNRYASGC